VADLPEVNGKLSFHFKAHQERQHLALCTGGPKGRSIPTLAYMWLPLTKNAPSVGFEVAWKSSLEEAVPPRPHWNIEQAGYSLFREDEIVRQLECALLEDTSGSLAQRLQSVLSCTFNPPDKRCKYEPSKLIF
jgi:hypothetical protein